MILAVDIGNTTISVAILEGKKVKSTWLIATVASQRALRKEFFRKLSSIKKHSSSLEAIIICSVVPRALNIVKPILEKAFPLKPLVVGRDIKVPIRNLYKKPSQVGQDRLVCAFAAKILYGAPTIVVDFGTAITFDVISKKGEYLGGIIIPGLRLYAESLFEKTALLPKVNIRKPKSIIGRDTEESILSGIFYGYGVLCSGMIQLLSKQMRQKPRVIITGGYAAMIKSFIKGAHVTDKNLIFKGLSLIYNKFFPSYC